MKEMIKPGILLILLCMNLNAWKVHAAPPGDNGAGSWWLSVRAGTTILLSEITRDFRFLENEFNHHPGFSVDLSLSKILGDHWEPGVNLAVYRLTGATPQPRFSATGIFGPFNNLYPGIPVEYENMSGSLLFSVRYFVFSLPDQHPRGFHLSPFIEAGGGLNVFASEVHYESVPPGMESSLIWEKAGKNMGNVAQISLGIGTKMNIGRNWDFLFALNTEWIDYDCVDGVHNYTGGERDHARALMPRLMAGIAIPLGGSSLGRSPESDYLPWSQ